MNFGKINKKVMEMDRPLKMLIVFFGGFPMLLCFLFWNGGHFKGVGASPFRQHLSQKDNSMACSIDGTKLFLIGDDVDVSFFQMYAISGFKAYRFYHVFFIDETENRINFITYKFPLTTGVGAIIENTDMIIENSSDTITIYYDKEPIDGFLLEHNPFSKKILFERLDNLKSLKKHEGVCYL